MHLTKEVTSKTAPSAPFLLDFKTPALAGQVPIFTLNYRIPHADEFNQTMKGVRERLFELGHPDERGWDAEESLNHGAPFFKDHPLRFNYPNLSRDVHHVYTGDIQNGGIGKRLTQQLLQPEGQLFTATYVAPTLYDLGFRPGEPIKELDPDVQSPISVEARLYAKIYNVPLVRSREELGYIPYMELFKKFQEYGLVYCSPLVTSPLLHLMGVNYLPYERTVIMADHLYDNHYPDFGRFLGMHHQVTLETVGRIQSLCINFPVFKGSYEDNPIGGFRIGKVPPVRETKYAKMLNHSPGSTVNYDVGRIAEGPNPLTGAYGFLNLRLLCQVDPNFRTPKGESLFGVNQVEVPGVENISVERILSAGNIHSINMNVGTPVGVGYR